MNLTNRTFALFFFGTLVSLFATAGCAQEDSQNLSENTIVISGIRVIDGLGNEPIESKEVAEVLVVETNRAFLYLERLREKGLVDFEGHVGGPSVPVTLTEEGRRFASDHILREAGKSVTQMLLEKLEASALGILLQEIYKDVMASPSIREILVLSNNRVPFEHAKPCFVYYMDDHPNLRFHFDILTNHGLIVVVKGDDPTAPIYRINEHFVATVLAEHDASKPLERGPS